MTHDTVTFAGKRLQKPPALKPGDTIALVAPATPLSRDEVQEQIDNLKKRGYKVVNYAKSHWFNKHYLSDTDEARAEDINRAFADPKVKGVFPVQGGGGTFRKDFLDRINWKVVKKNPKVVIGYSDITYLHLALRKHANMVSFHSGFPYLDDNYRPNSDLFWSMVENPGKIPPPVKAGRKYQCIVPGTATGELIGGNLSMLTSAIGTPYEPDFKGKILLLEDWKDDYESVDRLMTQLTNRGVWKQVKGVIIGEFKYVPRKPEYTDLNWDKFIRDVTRAAQQEGIPIGYNFPVGHGINNRPMPLGTRVQFNSETGTVTFLESPVK